MHVEVVYALPERQTRLIVEVPPGTTLREIVERSGIRTLHPEIDLARNVVGVYGARRGVDERAAEGDRVEIYRPLAADPKEARRRRARRGG